MWVETIVLDYLFPTLFPIVAFWGHVVEHFENYEKVNEHHGNFWGVCGNIKISKTQNCLKIKRLTHYFRYDKYCPKPK